MPTWLGLPVKERIRRKEEGGQALRGCPKEIIDRLGLGIGREDVQTLDRLKCLPNGLAVGSSHIALVWLSPSCERAFVWNKHPVVPFSICLQAWSPHDGLHLLDKKGFCPAMNSSFLPFLPSVPFHDCLVAVTTFSSLSPLASLAFCPLTQLSLFRRVPVIRC